MRTLRAVLALARLAVAGDAASFASLFASFRSDRDRGCFARGDGSRPPSAWIY